MLILISSAKTMIADSKIKVPGITSPRFASDASEIALQMAQYSANELSQILKVNPKIAAENYYRFHEYHSDENRGLPAVLAYTGVVYKNIGLKDFTQADFSYAQEHLRIGSGVYGLLRPLDAIKLYRMEYDVRIPEFGDQRIDAFWRDKITDTLIDDVKKSGGTLINLAASDVLPSFHWKKVEQAVRVITPDFKMYKGDKLKSIVIYLKMARGKMARHILKNRIENPDALRSFSWEGFVFNEDLSQKKNWIYTQL